jgi:hypothetical protein
MIIRGQFYMIDDSSTVINIRGDSYRLKEKRRTKSSRTDIEVLALATLLAALATMRNFQQAKSVSHSNRNT